MLKFNNRTLTYNNRWLNEDEIPNPYNPLGLPPYTIRLLFADGDNPQYWRINDGYVWSQVSSSPNIWDLTYNKTDWQQLFADHFGSNYRLLKVLGANTTGVTFMWRMFDECYTLNEVAIFDTSRVVGTARMFINCTSLTTIPLLNTSNVLDMTDMFHGCTSLTTIPLLDTSHCVSTNSMFNGCSSLTSVPLLDLSSCTDAGGMFLACSSLSTIPLFNTSNIVSMASMFIYCSSLKSIPLFNTNKVTDVRNCFGGCVNVETGILSMYNQLVNQVPSKVYHSGCFWNCGSNTTSGAAELAQIPSDWKN